jgi:hypothetical protein
MRPSHVSSLVDLPHVSSALGAQAHDRSAAIKPVGA